MEDDDLNFNLASILNDFKSSPEKKFELDSILNLIKKNQTNPKIVAKFLQQLKQSVSLLSPDNFENNVVNMALIEIKWPTYFSHDPKILELLFEFFVDLNNAYTNYIYKSVSTIVKTFFTTCNDPALASQESIDCQAIYTLAHKIIESLFKIAPTCQAHVVKIVEQGFPYMIKESHVQRAFLSNVLRLANNYSNLRLQLLEICIQKLLKIDVNLSREAIVGESESLDEEEEPDHLSMLFYIFSLLSFSKR